MADTGGRENLLLEVESLAKEIKFDHNLTKLKREMKRNKLADVLLCLFRLNRYSSSRYLRDSKLSNHSDLFERKYEETNSWYDSMAFCEAMIDAFAKYGEGVDATKKYWELFEPFYRVKSQECKAKRLTEYYGTTAEFREQEIKEHLAELGQCNPSDIRFNVLNREKTIAKIKAFYGLLPEESLPSKEQQWLDKVFAEVVMGMYEETENKKGEKIYSVDADTAGSQQNQSEQKQKNCNVLLNLLEKYEDKYVRAYLYYKILVTARSYSLDNFLVDQVPEQFRSMFLEISPNEESKASRNEFLGKYFGLKPDTIRKKMIKVESKLMAEQNFY